MTDKKASKTEKQTKAGATELTEEELEQAQGGGNLASSTRSEREKGKKYNAPDTWPVKWS